LALFFLARLDAFFVFDASADQQGRSNLSDSRGQVRFARASEAARARQDEIYLGRSIQGVLGRLSVFPSAGRAKGIQSPKSFFALYFRSLSRVLIRRRFVAAFLFFYY
jgi:hypothetical protein